MEMLRINADAPEKEFVSYAAEEIRKGRILVYPTDTVYGLGCSINAIESIKKIFMIKKRSPENPLSVAFPDLETARDHTSLSSEEEEFIKKHVKDPFTFVVKKKNILDIITANKDTVGMRIPNHRVLKTLLYHAETPVISTSANISGNKAPVNVREIDKEIMEKVDLVVDSGPCRIGSPSTVVDVSSGRILRA